MNTTYTPINGLSRSERIYFSSMCNPVSWTYFKMLREHNNTRKVYEIDPYIEVYRYRENLYALYHPNCDGGGDAWMYLVVGPEKAMLIDTGYGLGNLKGLADTLSGGRELIVVNTHAHPDHCLGNFRFETVYCHEYETENTRNKCVPGAFDYLFDKNGSNIWLKFEREALPEYRDVTIIGVPDHYTWDLGKGYEIELIWTGGHAPGHAAYLDKKNRVLFAGDVAVSDLVGIGAPKKGVLNQQYRTVSAYQKNLGNLVKRLDEFDHIFPGHFVIDIESRVLIDLYEALTAIVENPDSYDFKQQYTSGNTGEPVEKLIKRVKGFGAIAYERSSVYPIGEEPDWYPVERPDWYPSADSPDGCKE